MLTVLISKTGLYAGLGEAIHINPLLTTAYIKNYDESDLILKFPGAAVGAPVFNDATENSITIDSVDPPGNGQDVEYGISKTDNANDAIWQPVPVFSGLIPGTNYYIFTRSAENEDYAPGAAGARLHVITMTNSAHWDSALAAIRNGGSGTAGNLKTYTLVVIGNVEITGITGTGSCFGSVQYIEATLKGSGTLSPNGSTGQIFCLGGNQTLIIDDENIILQGRSGNTYQTVYIQSGGTLKLKNGAINGCNGSVGIGIGSTFAMSGGTISGNASNCGVDVSGSFTMTGGSISGNTSISDGGGVRVASSGSFTMTGGTISGNTSSGVGGGVHVAASGSFTMTGGIVYGNNAGSPLANTASYGAALYLESGTAKYGDGTNILPHTEGELNYTDYTITPGSNGGAPDTDYDITGTGTFSYDGTAKTVTITPKAGASPGAVIIWYEGISPTVYAKSTTAPVNNGTYNATFDVAESAPFPALAGLKAGTITIESQSPSAGDYTASGTGTFVYNGSARTVTITPKTGASPGAITVWYTGTSPTVYAKSATAPANAGTYAVTFDVAAVPGWDAAAGFAAGNIIINKAGGAEIVSLTTNGTPTCNAITLNAAALTPATGQDILYGISTVNNANSAAWQTGLVFSGLNPTTTYYIFAYSAGNSNYNEGPVKSLAAVTAAHNWGAWTVTTPATFIAPGVETRYCQHPGCTEFETQPAAQLPITNASDWADACSQLNGKTGSYTLTVTGNFSVAGSDSNNTFGATPSGSLTVTITGSQTVSLTGTGSLLRIGNSQTVVMQDINFAGNSSNTSPLVYVSGTNSALVMSGSASVSGNTTNGTGGAGVLVSNGSFTMQDNASVYDNTSTSGNGGGVWVNSGNMTMKDGTISGNKANLGGGVYVSGAGSAFTISGGTIYGSSASPSSLRNISTAATPEGASLFVSQGAAKYGDGNDIPLLNSVTVSNGKYSNDTLTGKGLALGTTKDFWANNFQNNTSYQTQAQLMAIGYYCTVWAETGSGVSGTTASSMAAAFDNDIYPKMIAAFSLNSGTYNGVTYANTMDLADAYFGDGDGKMCILLLDIKDNVATTGSYVAGYFWAGNFYSYSDSNKCDMIYVDTYPGQPGSLASNRTLAHEMQHLMNWTSSQINRSGASMSTWINEGLSGAAEWVYLQNHDNGRMTWFNNDTTGLIRKGNNFFVWDNRNNENVQAVLDDYATVYLFFQWLRLQSGGSSSIYKNIISSSSTGYQAVLNAMPAYSTWGDLLKTWLAANYINAASGPYGYMNDATLKNVKAKTAAQGTTSLPLYPGEGVYSVTSSAGAVPGQSGNIRYAGLNTASPALSDTNVFAGGILLTYNVNTSLTGPTETGTTTGVSASIIPAMQNLQTQDQLTGPFAISGAEALRQNGYSEKPLPPYTRRP
ncbi:MAG: hypothetical protein FWH38_03580 [Treponema sp.]|nr:hypothetical protein [Treponema sp.]